MINALAQDRIIIIHAKWTGIVLINGRLPVGSRKFNDFGPVHDCIKRINCPRISRLTPPKLPPQLVEVG